MPLDALTAARLARDGERPSSAAPHVLGPALGVHPAREARRLGARDLLAGRPPGPGGRARGGRRGVRASTRRASRTGIDDCGILTYAFPLREVARAFAILADPDALPADDPRVALAPHYVEIRDAMLAYPELVAGTRDRLDTSLMKATAGRCVSKSGAEGLRGIGDPARPAQRRRRARVGRGDQDRGRRRRGPRAVGGVGRGAAPGRGASRARRCASSPATTGRRALDPHGRPGRRGDPGVRARAGGRAASADARRRLRA